MSDDLELDGEIVSDIFVPNIDKSQLPMPVIKYMIEKRYKRLGKARRIGVEYVTPDDIRETFTCYVRKDNLPEWYKKTDKDLIDWFEDWVDKVGQPHNLLPK